MISVYRTGTGVYAPKDSAKNGGEWIVTQTKRGCAKLEINANPGIAAESTPRT
jgi:hypothetical protein